MIYDNQICFWILLRYKKCQYWWKTSRETCDYALYKTIRFTVTYIYMTTALQNKIRIIFSPHPRRHWCQILWHKSGQKHPRLNKFDWRCLSNWIGDDRNWTLKGLKEPFLFDNLSRINKKKSPSTLHWPKHSSDWLAVKCGLLITVYCTSTVITVAIWKKEL